MWRLRILVSAKIGLTYLNELGIPGQVECLIKVSKSAEVSLSLVQPKGQACQS